MGSIDNDEDMLWDFSLAHAGPEQAVAEVFHDTLIDLGEPDHPVRVFLASRCLKLGDDWDIELARAQRKSRVTVVLVSEHAGTAYHQREEVATAIAMARDNSTRCRVVPLFLGSDTDSCHAMPYGLRLKHGLRVSNADDFQQAVFRLLELLEDIQIEF